ncbi:MAG: phosphatase PAP2 family protein [Gemmatimonadales bacterium]
MALGPTRPAERILVGYSVFVLAIALWRWQAGLEHMGWVVAAYLLIFALVGLLTVPGQVGPLLRGLAPIAILLAVYGSLDLLSGFGAAPTHDTTVRRWEVALFGREIARTWWQTAPSRFWSTVFHGAYLAYYLVVPAPIVFFAVRRSGQDLDRVATALLAVFAACYVVFILLPVAGPYYEYPRPAAWFLANPAAQLSYGILSGGSSYGAAFPSSHVAGTWAAAGAAWLGNRRLGTVLLMPALLLSVGVVYCQMHYGVDALGGVAVGAGGVLLAHRLHPRTTTSDRSAPDN